MEPENEIINRVASSGLTTFDLEEYFSEGERVVVDIKDQLYQGLILKEKDFRAYIKATDWSLYKDKFVAIQCSGDAIIPTWAYMLVALALNNSARRVIYGTLEELESQLYFDSLSNVDWDQFKDLKIVIKGCSKINVPTSAYIEVCNKLKPVAASIMFGEPCSTVPLHKKPKLY